MLDALATLFLIGLGIAFVRTLRKDLRRIGILMVLLSLKAHAQETYQHNGQTISKRDAMVKLLQEPSAEIMRCQAIELTPKMTLKVRKDKKSRE